MRPDTDVTIRPVRASEHEALGEITVRAYLDGGFVTGESDDYAKELRDVAGRVVDAEVLVAVEHERVLGGVAFVPAGSPMSELSGPGEAEIRMLAVDPTGHGRGVGTALAAACVDRARAAAGVKRMVLCSLPAMTTAHRIYGRLGFERAPELDWAPVPGITLWAFALDL